MDMEASSALCSHIQKQGLHSHVFSDITLSFLGKDYLLHKIILSQSPYFCSLLSGPWKEHGEPRIELQIDDPNVTAEVLESALAYMYGVSPVLTGDNVISILAAGSFLGLENLCENSIRFALKDLKVETFARYQHLAEQHCYGNFADALKNACWSLLCTHAARELLHHLPKLSLEVLYHLLKSDELWVNSEVERYKFAKQALIDWKLARIGTAGVSFDRVMPRKARATSSYSRKSSRIIRASANFRNRKAQRGGLTISKEHSSKRKLVDPLPLAEQLKDGCETDLQKLRRLWEEDYSEQVDECKEGFKSCTEIFTGGGIIFAHMEADELLQVRKELEDANLPPDVANDSLWHSVFLKAHLLKLKKTHNSVDSSSSDESDDDDDEMEEEEEDDDEEDAELSERDISDGEAAVTRSKKLQNSSLVCFTLETSSLDSFDPKKRKTTGGFTWIAKPDMGMRLENFPPFRFGAEFVTKAKVCVPSLVSQSAVFYGGATWEIRVSSIDGIHCKLYALVTDRDLWSKVRFMAELYIRTTSGLSCESGTGQVVGRSITCCGIHLTREDVVEDEPLRASAVVQLIDA